MSQKVDRVCLRGRLETNPLPDIKVVSSAGFCSVTWVDRGLTGGGGMEKQNPRADWKPAIDDRE